MNKNLVSINQLSFAHETGRLIFENINLTIPQGKITAVLGPSGTGKTTLLKLIGGQLIPTAGEVWVDGQCIHALDRRRLYQARKKMGLLFQSGGLFTHLNVFENVAFPLREHTTLSESMLRTLVMMKLHMVGLRGARHLMPNELSGGMARRVALARAIVMDPQLIMYDEPFTGQDPVSMGVLMTLIRTLNKALKLTSIIVSHDIEAIFKIADYVYVIADKKIISEGTVEVIKKDPSAQLQQFLQGLPDGPVPFHYPAKSWLDDLLEVEE